MVRTINCLFLILSTLLLPGCKLAIIDAEGGEVHSLSHGTCSTEMVCVIEVRNTLFTELFEAVPEEGWYFHKWNSGERFFCGGSSNPKCILSLENAMGNADIEDLVASSEVFYLMPVFKDYPRSKLVDGKPRVIEVEGERWQWLQPADFVNYSYNEVSAVCPDGICSGTLPGSAIDLTGYTWASSNEFDLLGLAYQQAGVPLTDEFKETPNPGLYGQGLIGLLRDPPQEPNGSVIFGYNISYEDEDYQIGDAGFELSKDDSIALAGIWFWRHID